MTEFVRWIVRKHVPVGNNTPTHIGLSPPCVPVCAHSHNPKHSTRGLRCTMQGMPAHSRGEVKVAEGEGEVAGCWNLGVQETHRRSCTPQKASSLHRKLPRSPNQSHASA